MLERQKQNQDKLDQLEGELRQLNKNLEHKKKVHSLKEKEVNNFKANGKKFEPSSPPNLRRRTSKIYTSSQMSGMKSGGGGRSSSESPSRPGGMK